MNVNLEGFEIYKGKSFSSLCKEIVVNQNEKKDQIDILVNDLRPLIKSVSDAIVIVPLIKEYFDVGVKNDEQLVKLAAVIQRIVTKNENSGDADNFMISDEEKQELLKTLEESSIEIPKQESDEKVEDNIPINAESKI